MTSRNATMALLVTSGLLLVLLSGCASKPQVLVVPCKTQVVEKPVSEFDQLPAKSSVFEMVKALLVDREASKAYQIKLESQVNSCK